MTLKQMKLRNRNHNKIEQKT